VVALHCEFDALPFPNHSLDLVVLPHALELARDPHLTLREVERVLVPEGRVVITGFNPLSLWGLRQHAGHLRRRLGFGPAQAAVPAARRRVHRLLAAARLVAAARLRGRGRALRLLAAAASRANAGSSASPGWTAWATAGGRCWARVYFLVAVKRVRGMRLVGLVRRESRARARRRRPWRSAGPSRRCTPTCVASWRRPQAIVSADASEPVVIYTDGACKGNPGPAAGAPGCGRVRTRRNCSAARR
jgi:SAM-dependent methyltransferase